MRILKILLSTVVVLSVIFVAGGFLIPPAWMVERHITINASAEKIYPLVSDFREWDKWSPWSASKDASLHYTYDGPDTGIGAKQSWTSDKMGKGWMQFTAANPQTGVSYELYIDMGRYQSTLQGNIIFASENAATKVTWTDHGYSGKNMISRWMSLFIKRMIGREFDKGLANLKSMVEKQ